MWIEGDGGFAVTVLAANAKGEVMELANYEPAYPWADVHLIGTSAGAQWLITAYKSDVDRADGRTFFVEVYALGSKERVLQAYCADVELGDFDGNNTVDLALYQVLSRTKYPIQLGWPIVYELSETLTIMGLDNFPELARGFAAQIEARIAHLESVCDVVRPCQYSADITLLNAQLRLVRGVLSGGRGL